MSSHDWRREASSEIPSSRRAFLRNAGIAAFAAAVAAAPTGIARSGEPARKKAAWEEAPTGAFAPFRMALQSYSLRKRDFTEMVETVYELGLTYVDLWPEHFPWTLSDSDVRMRLRMMRYNTCRRIAYGVVEFTEDPILTRDVFEFALRRLGVYALVSRPAPDSFEAVEKYVEQTGIRVAIHNHGPEDKLYGTPELLEKALKDRHKKIGLCVDTGHFLRVGANPVDVVKAFKERVYAVHLKDVKVVAGERRDVVVGEGELELVPLLRALRDAGFAGGLALEYEAEPDDPVPGIKRSLAAIEKAVKEVAA